METTEILTTRLASTHLFYLPSKMPLVVPGINNNSVDKTEEWSNKLVGKTLSEEPSSETVGATLLPTLVSSQTSSWPRKLMFCRRRPSARKTYPSSAVSSAPASF